MKKLTAIIFGLSALLFNAQPALADTEEAVKNTLANSVCPVCGLCPAPFGICLFILLAAVFALALILFLIFGRGKRCPLCHARCKRKAYTCDNCGYDFESGFQSTMTIRVADSPELMALQARAKMEAATQTPPQYSVPATAQPASPAASSLAYQPPQAASNQGGTICPVCGTQLPAGAMFCGKCGRRL